MKKHVPVLKSFICAASLVLTFSVSAFAVERPVLPLPQAGEIEEQCRVKLADLNQKVAELESVPVETLEGAEAFLKGWNRLQIGIENLQGPMALLSQVSPDPVVRKNADACSIKVQRFITDVFQNGKLYRNMRIVRVNDDEERKLRQDTVSAYEDAGVSLMPDKRKRVKQILARLAEIDQEYNRNIRENKTRLVFSPYELKSILTGFRKMKKEIICWAFPIRNTFRSCNMRKMTRPEKNTVLLLSTAERLSIFSFCRRR